MIVKHSIQNESSAVFQNSRLILDSINKLYKPFLIYSEIFLATVLATFLKKPVAIVFLEDIKHLPVKLKVFSRHGYWFGNKKPVAKIFSTISRT